MNDPSTATEPMRRSPSGVDLPSLLLAVRNRWPLLVLGLVLGGLVGLVASAGLGPRWVASVTARGTAAPDPGEEPMQDPEAIAAELDRLTFELRSESLRQQVSERLGGPAIELTSGIPEESTLVTVEARAPSAELAASAAELAVELLVDRRRTESVAAAEATATRLREQAQALARMAADVSSRIPEVDPVTAATADTPTAARLRRRVEILLDQQAAYERRATDVEIAGETGPIGVERVTGGPAAARPAAPTRTDLVLLLAAVGAIVVLALVWLVEQRRGPLVTRQGLVRRADAPVVDARSTVELEVLALSLVDHPNGTAPAIGYVQVGTSQLDLDPGAIPLAAAMASLGPRVSVVDGDLRSGRRGDRPGLASYLGGGAEPDAMVHPGTDSPHIVAADPPPPTSPLRLARSTPLAPLFDALGGDSAVVVMAVPDPVRRPESLVLLADTSGVVLEVQPGRLRQRRLDTLVAQLDAADLALLGVVTTPGQTFGARGAGGTQANASPAPRTTSGSTSVRRVTQDARHRPGEGKGGLWTSGHDARSTSS